MIISHRGRIIVVALALAAGVVPAWWYFGKSAPQQDPRKTESQEASSGRNAATATQTGPAVDVTSPWHVGTELRYSVDFGSTLESVGAEADDDDRTLALTGSAKLTLTASRVDDKKLVLTGRVTGLAFAVGNDKASEHKLEQSLTEGIEKPFLLTLSRRGHIESISTDKNVRGMPHSLLRNIVAALQFVGPETPGQPTWETLESDQYGQFKARYETPSPLHFTKTKLDYVTLEIAQQLQVGNQPIRAKVDSKTELEVDDRGLLRRVASREAMLLPLGDSGFKTQAHATLVLENVGEGRPDLLATMDLVTGELSVTRGGMSRTATELKEKQDLVAGASFSDLASKLDSVRSPEARSERIDLMARMTALLDLDPGSIDDLTARLRAGGPKEDQDLLLGALSDSSAPAAQSALGDLARDDTLDQKTRGDAVSHLGFQEHPTDETFAALEELSAPGASPAVEGSATLALGGAARRANEAGESPEAVERAVSTLVRKAGSATTPEAQRNVIDALGNSGSTAALPAIRTALGNPSPVVRAAAVSALRHIPGEEAERLVADTLRADEVDFVRSAAAGTVRKRGFTPFTSGVVVAQLGADKAANVRMTLVDVVGGWLEVEPALRATLEATAARDESEDVRTAAAQVLKGGPNRGG